MDTLVPISGWPAFISVVAKCILVFTAMMVTVAYTTLAERKISAWIQDRSGPNRVGPFGLFQPLADGLKNMLKEETLPATANRFWFVAGPMMAIMPALVTIAVVPFAAPFPVPFGWGAEEGSTAVVDMIVADVPMGILYILGLGSLGVYGIVLSGWASNNKYSFLGGLRASAQMVSYEVALGLSLVTVLMLAGNVTLTQIVIKQQEMGLWFALPLSLGFILFLISAFAETNRLPFDMPEAESELVTGYHTEYSSMKFSMFFIAEYAHMVTASALMATLFFGGWDLPGSWDNAWWHEGMLISGFDAAGAPVAANPAWWKSIITYLGFAAKTGFFLFTYIWVRWTLPRFRYDQVMTLGWKVMLPTALGYVMIISGTILTLDHLEIGYGFTFGLVMTLISGLCTVAFVFFLDSDRVISGASVPHRQSRPVRMPDTTVVAPLARGETPVEVSGD
jgi:NADH-quinone oxidoreductase subunit H